MSSRMTLKSCVTGAPGQPGAVAISHTNFGSETVLRIVIVKAKSTILKFATSVISTLL